MLLFIMCTIFNIDILQIITFLALVSFICKYAIQPNKVSILPLFLHYIFSSFNVLLPANQI